jgi:hypothetical protein
MIIFNQIKNKISLAALAIPVYAALELKPQGDDFSSLEKVTAPNIISGAVSLVLIITFVVFFFILVLGAFKWITSSGDEKKIAAARSQITNALIGVVLILSVWAILNLIEILFDIKILNGLSIPSFTGSNSGSSGLIENSH